MQVYRDIPQLSKEWFALKSGMPSGSRAGKIITPVAGNLSAQAEAYIDALIAELMGLAEPDSFSSGPMDDGLEKEPEARALFEFDTGLDVQQIGWITNDEGTAGCSPDGLIESAAAGLEIKCPLACTHIGWTRHWRETGAMPAKHKPQVHWSMIITGLRRWYFMSYVPSTDPLIIEVTADNYTDKVSAAITEFTARLAEESERFGLSQPERKAA